MLGLVVWLSGGFGAQHVEVVVDRGFDLGLGLIFTDANDGESQLGQRGYHCGLAPHPRKAVCYERLVLKLLAKSDAGKANDSAPPRELH